MLVAALVLSACSQSAERWPSRPVELVVFSAPGGGTDLACRSLAAAMERELGNPIRVSNMTGGRGGAAAQYVSERAGDGYRWLGASETVLSLAIRGAHPTTSKDWHYFILAGSPGVLSVPFQSPHETFEDLLEASRKQPDRFTVAASGAGSIWHLRAEVLRRHGNLPLRYIPYQGSSPSQIAALSGEVDAVLTSLAEQLHYLRGKQLRPLVMVEREPLHLKEWNTIPAVTDWLSQLKDHFPLPQWLGFMIPRKTDPEVVDTITAAFHNALKSEEVREFLQKTGNEAYGLSGEEADRMIRHLESLLCWRLYDLELAQHSPGNYGISRPAVTSNE